MWQRWRREGGTGAQQETDGSKVVSAELVEMGRGGTGQGRDRDEGDSRVTDAEEVCGTTIRDR